MASNSSRQAGSTQQEAAERLTIMHDRFAQLCGKIAEVRGQDRGVLRLSDQQLIDRALELLRRRGQGRTVGRIGIQIRCLGLFELRKA